MPSQQQVVKRRKGAHGSIKESSGDSSKSYELLQLEDIRKDYLLALAAQELSDIGPPNNFDLEPTEAVSKYVTAGRLDRAVSLASAFGMDLTSVFQSIAERCVNFTASERVNRPVSDRQLIIVSQDSPYVPSDAEFGASKRAWKLLEVYLDKYDGVTSHFSYHRAVLEKILEQDASIEIPPWLVQIYKGPGRSKSSDDYLRALLKFDRLEEATLYAIDILSQERSTKLHQANVGNVPQSGYRRIPVTLIDSLLDALDDVLSTSGKMTRSDRKTLSRLKTELEDNIVAYIDE
ncbi:hypothetical protein HDU93_005902, partial [Gonapodya sp. JEL0774]